MSYLDQAVQAKKRFQQAIASRAKPDSGIQLKRSCGVNGYQAKLEEQRRLVVAREKKIAQQAFWLKNLLECRETTQPIEKNVVVTDINLRCNPAITAAPISDYLTRRYPSLSLIKRVVCEQYSISITDIAGASRCTNLITPRHVAFYIARELTLKSLPDIGRAFGGRDHTTVLYGRDKIKERLKTDEQLRDEIDKLIAKIRQEIRA